MVPSNANPTGRVVRDEISDEALEAAAAGISATNGYWACPYDD
jgi:hypothetical protein